MDEIDRIIKKYRNSHNLYEIFLSPELGGKWPREISVATFLKLQELHEYLINISQDIKHIIERQHLMINNFDEEIGVLKKRLTELQRTNMREKD